MLRSLGTCRPQCFHGSSGCPLLSTCIHNAPAARPAWHRAGAACSASSATAHPTAPYRTSSSSSSSTLSAPSQPGLGPAGRREKKLCVVDGHNIAFRAYFGIYKSPLSALATQEGIPTTLAFGFMRTLLALIEQEHPDGVVVVFDEPGGATFRREALPYYKAHRERPAPDFAVDLANLRLLLQFARVPTLSVPGFEADDVMAGLAAQAKTSGWRTLLVSTDKDLWQVVDDAGGVAALLPTHIGGGRTSSKSSPPPYIDEAAVQQELGVPPALVPDLKALMGDSSDNIPGIPGIGIKTATELLQRQGCVEAVFDNSAAEKKGLAGKLAGQRENAALYKSLTTVRPEAAPPYDLDCARLRGFASAELEPLLRRLEMTSLLKDMPRLHRLLGGTAAADAQLEAALPAALQQIAASTAASRSEHNPAQGGGAGTQEQQPAAASASQPAEGSQGVGGSAGAGAAGRPDAGVESAGPLPSSQSAGTQDSVLSAVPAVRCITSTQGLQALVLELTQQQTEAAWSWPQHTPYRPGHRQQEPPQVVCCAWQSQPSLQPPATPSASSSSNGTGTGSAAAGDTAASAPRRRRRTRAATATQQQQQQQQQLPTQPPLSTPLPGCSAAPSSSSVLHLAVVVPGVQLPPADLLSTLRPLLESEAQPKVLFESKRAYTELRHQGIQLTGVCFDVLVAGCLPDPQRWTEVLDPQRQQAAVLPAMTQHVLSTTLQDMAAALQASSAAQGQQPEQVWHAAAEVWAALLLRHSFGGVMQRLGDGGQLLQLFASIELPLQAVLSDMEVTGVHCDKQVLLQQREQLQAEVAALEAQLYSIAGRRFKLSSPKECSAVMFDELRLAGKGIKKTKSGYYSTSMSEVEKLEDSPFKAAYLEWSRLNSLLSKYYGGTYMDAINPDTGRIHTTYHQVGVATGRLASSNPNMQSVPAHDERGKMFRAAFTAEEGYLLVAADYSQVELRVMAGLSGDEALLAAFADDQDVHAATAREVLGKAPQDPLSPEERQLGKRVNFSIVYGAGARQLAAELGMRQKEAQLFLDKFKAAHPKLFAYKTHCMRSAVAWGYTLSAAGRRRTYRFSSPGLLALRGEENLEQLPDMQGLQQLAGRDDVHVLLQASNAPVQGSSADLLKAALIQLHRRLVGTTHGCRLMLTAHDDVLLEVPQQEWPALQGTLQAIMQGALPQRAGLVLKADVAAGSSWLDCK